MTVFKILSVLCFCSFYLSVKACDVCGNYMGITPYDNKHSISFLHRYRVFNGYKDYQQQSSLFPSQAYKIMHGETPVDSSSNNKPNYSSKDFESYKVFELRLKCFLMKRLEINAFIPFINNKIKTDNNYSSVSGFGDVSINAGYHCITPKQSNKIRSKLIVGLGLKFPTGKNYLNDNLHNRLPFELQAGTGSIDGLAYLNYTMMSKRLGFNVSTNYKISSTNLYLERLANSTTNFASLFVKLSLKNVSFYPSVQANYEYTKGLYINKHLVNNSAINALLIGPGLDVYYKSFSVNMSCQFTAYEKLKSGYLKSAGRLVLGVNYSFSKKDTS